MFLGLAHLANCVTGPSPKLSQPMIAAKSKCYFAESTDSYGRNTNYLGSSLAWEKSSTLSFLFLGKDHPYFSPIGEKSFPFSFLCKERSVSLYLISMRGSFCSDLMPGKYPTHSPICFLV